MRHVIPDTCLKVTQHNFDVRGICNDTSEVTDRIPSHSTHPLTTEMQETKERNADI
jgi:hypothetical protein